MVLWYYQDNHEAGQYITIEIYDSSNNLIKTYTNKTGIYGNITLDVNNLDIGEYSVIAYHISDEYYSSIYNSTIFTITKLKTNTTLNVNTTSIYIGDKVMITPVVKAGSITITNGNIEIYDGDTLITDITAGDSFIYEPTSVGTSTITAYYLGDSNYGSSVSDAVDIIVKKLDVNVSIDVDEVTYPNAPIAIITANATGTYDVYINGKHYTVTLNEGETTKSVTGITLNVGEGYIANVKFNETDKYNEANASTTFNVINGTINVSVVVSDVTYPDHAVAVVSGSVDGEYVVTVNNKNYTVAVSGGTGSVDIDVLPVGDYTAVVTANISNYNPVSEYDTFKVVNGIINVHIEVNDTVYPNHPIANVTATLDGDYVIVVTLINSNSSSTNKTFNIHVADGKAIVDLGRLDAGNYSATVTGDIEGYSIVSDTDEFEVKKANPCLDAISSPKNPVYNQDNIHIDPLLPSDATGTVTYIVDDNKPITLGLNETFKFTPDKAGKHKIVVIYNGDNNYLTDNMTLYVNVLKADTPMNINTDKSKHVTGNKIKFIVNLPKGATGTVTYYI